MLLHLQSGDRLLWIIVGSGLLVAANAIPYYLKYLRTLTQVEPEDESAAKGPCESAEDRLKLGTLEKLAQGPNYKLRASAIKIVAERSTQGAARSQLLRDLASTNPAKRQQALQAFRFLISHPSLRENPGISFSNDPSAFVAITECLVNLLPFHDNADGHGRADNPTLASPLLPHRRPPAEPLALRVLLHLLTKSSVSKALDAGLISRWLKHYPFPCSLPENGGRRQDVIKYFHSWCHEDPIMANVISILKAHHEGLVQLRRHGLAESPSDTCSTYRGIAQFPLSLDEESANTIHNVRANMVSGVPRPTIRQPPEISLASLRQQAEVERAARQRRREAAVYSEGNAPLTQDNIFQRQSSSNQIALPSLPLEADLDIEAELARINNEIERDWQLPEHQHQFQQEEEQISSSADDLIRPGISSNFWQWLTLNSTLARS